ncbi:MAG TPA: lipopolysaccharide transport periplasmic protein LptA [Gammaproteobacteria bacterium]|nr:lipopolysaccharide transport periplasmic protein LptA [Gammaproteobacteria bacterium]
MRRPPDPTLLAGLLLLLCCLVPAAAAQPIDIEADHAEFDSPSGTTLFRGNVVLRRGALTITADRITLYRSDGRVTRTVAEGAPARYSQTLPDGEEITAKAHEIEYLATGEQLLLSGQARLRHGRNRFSGEQITYDIRSKKVRAEGGEDSKQRVRAIIYPDRPETQ